MSAARPYRKAVVSPERSLKSDAPSETQRYPGGFKPLFAAARARSSLYRLGSVLSLDYYRSLSLPRRCKEIFPVQNNGEHGDALIKTRIIAQILSPGPWHEYCVNDITGLPQQHLSNSCGVFVLMYSLSFVTAGAFDFTEPDVPCIRRWWCLLLLENFPLRSDEERRATKRQMRHTEKNAQKASMTAKLQLLDLPMEVLDNKQHGVVNWGKWSETSKAELRVPFEMKECKICKTVFKSCSGFYGNGKRGCLRGFYHSIEDPDCCFTCQ